MSSEIPIVGIDLGTTLSTVSHMTAQGVQSIADGNGQRAIPSVVGFSGSEVSVGLAAVNKALRNPTGTIFDSKRMLGQRFDNPRIQELAKTWPFSIVRDEDGGILIEVPKGPKAQYKPYEISGEILKHLAKLVSDKFGQPVKSVIISVPAHFRAKQREETMEAARYAGLTVERLVNEPIAVAIACNFMSRNRRDRMILVFDFGGGALDISLVNVSGMIFTLKAIGGESRLGGRDLDQIIINHVLKATGREDLKNNGRVIAKIRRICEEAKVTLSDAKTYEFNIDCGDDDLSYTLDRDEFERIAKPLLDRIPVLVEHILKSSNTPKERIDHILLVGGSSKIPIVRSKVIDFFRKRPHEGLDPQEVVSIGVTLLTDQYKGGSAIPGIQDVQCG